MLPLTTKQAEFKALIQSRTRQGVPPTFEELSQASGLVKSGVHRMISELKKRGHVDFVPNRRQTLRIIEPDLPSLEGLTRKQLVRLHAQIEAALADRFAERV
jgi:SOS-response transcriptional repressor LexA